MHLHLSSDVLGWSVVKKRTTNIAETNEKRFKYDLLGEPNVMSQKQERAEKERSTSRKRKELTDSVTERTCPFPPSLRALVTADSDRPS